ncbi:uncharacterized protein LOC120242367 isoform X2 [Hyaena hyaena]|uniref:uncharacterized protein LOC120242367 isoform X2 n=1 Tax=Hyaena hyaena TaxID=95912 RepID=UPI0019204BD1|nr:uncharacterized protein LOC120242367 isoform X2 [Hyaena hyaena]
MSEEVGMVWLHLHPHLLLIHRHTQAPLGAALRPGSWEEHSEPSQTQSPERIDGWGNQGRAKLGLPFLECPHPPPQEDSLWAPCAGGGTHAQEAVLPRVLMEVNNSFIEIQFTHRTIHPPPPHPRAPFPSGEKPVLDVSRTWTHTPRGLPCLVPSLSVACSRRVWAPRSCSRPRDMRGGHVFYKEN